VHHRASFGLNQISSGVEESSEGQGDEKEQKLVTLREYSDGS
jgi:hypothetical protein